MDRKQTRSKQRRTKKLIADMTDEKLVQILETTIGELGIQVRHEKGDFHSAGCRVSEQKLIILKKTDEDSSKAKLLLKELAKFDTKNLNIPPAVQEQISIIRRQGSEGDTAA